MQVSLEPDEPLPPGGVIGGDLSDWHGCVVGQVANQLDKINRTAPRASGTMRLPARVALDFPLCVDASAQRTPLTLLDRTTSERVRRCSLSRWLGLRLIEDLGVGERAPHISRLLTPRPQPQPLR